MIDYGAHPHIGAFLAACRKDKGFSVESLALETRLKPAYITAIEADEIDQLPGKAYARGYIKSYAEALELDGEAIIEHYAKQRDLHKQFRFYEPKKVLTAERPTVNAMRFSYMLLAAIGVAWMLNIQQADRPAAVMDAPIMLQATNMSRSPLNTVCDEQQSQTPCYWQGESAWTDGVKPLHSVLELAQ